MNIPQTGPNIKKAKFFREIAQALEFLAIYNTLSAEDQLKINQLLTKLGAKHE